MTNTEWNASQYDNWHDYVSNYGQDVLTWLCPQKDEQIIDLGCGTGNLANLITQSGAVVTGIDASHEMIADARTKYPTICFKVEDGHHFTSAEPVDAVFSNAALHWMTRPTDVIASIWKALRPGGRFVAEMGGYGNIATIQNAIHKVLEEAGLQDPSKMNPWYFPSIAMYSHLLEQQGFHVRHALLFARPTPLHTDDSAFSIWLDTFATPYFESIAPHDRTAILQRVEDMCRSQLFDVLEERWVLDYVRLRIEAYKPA